MQDKLLRDLEDSDYYIRSRTVRAIAKLHDLENSDYYIRSCTARALAQLEAEEAIDKLQR